MNVALYYFDGCPSYQPALESLKTALRLEQWPDDVEMVRVANASDARRHRFIGSPTIRIDGVDVEGPDAEVRRYAFGCRVYTDGTGTAGWPSVEQIRHALHRALGDRPRPGASKEGS